MIKHSKKNLQLLSDVLEGFCVTIGKHSLNYVVAESMEVWMILYSVEYLHVDLQKTLPEGSRMVSNEAVKLGFAQSEVHA